MNNQQSGPISPKIFNSSASSACIDLTGNEEPNEPISALAPQPEFSIARKGKSMYIIVKTVVALKKAIDWPPIL